MQQCALKLKSVVILRSLSNLNSCHNGNEHFFSAIVPLEVAASHPQTVVGTWGAHGMAVVLDVFQAPLMILYGLLDSRSPAL